MLCSRMKAIAVLFVLLPLLILPCRVSASGRESFISWASGESTEIDQRWDRMTGSYQLEPVQLEGADYRSYQSSAPASGTWNRSINSSRFTGPVTGGRGRFPRTSRKRSGPTRGNFSFDNPASMNHGLSSRFRRPRGSSAYRWNSSSRRGSVSRPRLNRFGRVSSSSRRSRTGSNISPFSGRIRRRR